MMEAKGAGFKNLPKFVKEKFGQDGYERWLKSLVPKSQEIIKGPILAGTWYPFRFALLGPIKKLIELFYYDDPRKAREIGGHISDQTLTGIYKTFVKLGNPNYIIGKAGNVLATFYRPARLEVIENAQFSMIIRFVDFAEFENFFEEFVAGFIEHTLALCGCKNVEIKITSSLVSGEDYTEYKGTWNY